MINTYQTGPPPVPPRHDRSYPVLIPDPLASRGRSNHLIRFLVGVAVLHLLLSVGGLIYLFYIEKTERRPTAEAQAALLSSTKQEMYNKALAGMMVDPRTANKTTAGYLQWDMNHSVLKNINYYRESWLTVLQSGDYYVYSRVTFTKGDSASPLASKVMLRKAKTGRGKTLMQAYCNLASPTGSATIPRLCTATQGEVVPLEEGNQLSVWIENLSLVDYDDKATAFGMYRL